MPGLIDLHTHMGIVSGHDAAALSPAMTAALLFQNAELCIRSGHTTAREVAGADGALREVIDAGVIPGPRLFPSGPLLCQTGGHGDRGALYYPSIHNHQHSGIPGLAHFSITCDGPDSVRVAARQAFRQGATPLARWAPSSRRLPRTPPSSGNQTSGPSPRGNLLTSSASTATRSANLSYSITRTGWSS